MSAFLLSVLVAATAPAVGLQCEMRSAGGDLVRFELKPDGSWENPHVLLGALPGSAWPKGAASANAIESDGTVVAFRRDPKTGEMVGHADQPQRPEVEYRLDDTNGGDILRVEKEGQFKNATLYRQKHGGAGLPVGVGYCIVGDLAPVDETASLTATDPFDISHIETGCWLTAPGPGAMRTSFIFSAGQNGTTTAYFSSLGKPIWVKPVSVQRQIAQGLPEGPNGIKISIGRFRPDPGEEGPTGMDATFVDPELGQARTLIRFNKFRGPNSQGLGNQPGYAICGGRVTATGTVSQ